MPPVKVQKVKRLGSGGHTAPHGCSALQLSCKAATDNTETNEHCCSNKTFHGRRGLNFMSFCFLQNKSFVWYFKTIKNVKVIFSSWVEQKHETVGFGPQAWAADPCFGSGYPSRSLPLPHPSLLLRSPRRSPTAAQTQRPAVRGR